VWYSFKIERGIYTRLKSCKYLTQRKCKEKQLNNIYNIIQTKNTNNIMVTHEKQENIKALINA